MVHNDHTYLFLDSEGLGSLSQAATFDTQIFSLSLLLSSMFVLNTVGPINEGAIEQLDLVVNMTKQIYVTEKKGKKSSSSSSSSSASTSDDTDLSALSAYFPSFLWVLRDFTLTLETQDGVPLPASSYLEKGTATHHA